MSIVHDFIYHKPASLDEALGLLSKYQDKAYVLAGGTDLVCNLKEDVVKPKAVIDVKGIADLATLHWDERELWIGALITFNQIAHSRIVKDNFPLLMEAASSVGSYGLRNRATMVGNICSAVPCMDSAPALLVYDAHVHLMTKEGRKKIPISKWFTGVRKTAIKPGQLVLGVSIGLPAKRHSACYLKLGRYSGEDLAQVSVAAVVLPGNHYRVAFGSVGPVPIRSKKIESALNGKKISNKLLQEVQKLVVKEIFPITDIRASKEYRTHMSKVLFERSMLVAMARFNGNGPRYGAELL